MSMIGNIAQEGILKEYLVKVKNILNGTYGEVFEVIDLVRALKRDLEADIKMAENGWL